MKKAFRIFGMVLALFMTIYPLLSISASASIHIDQEAINYVNSAERTDAISEEEAIVAQHIYRLRDQETDLNTLIFKNADETTTLYYFTDAIKYIDSDGMVQDKSNSLTELTQSKYLYSNLHNDINSYFPKSLNSDGVLLSAGSYQIELTPKQDFVLQTRTELIASDAKLKNSNSVCYDNIFGLGTSLTYTPLFNGVKEDIYLSKNVGNTFIFIADMTALTPVISGGTILLMDGDDIVGQFGELLVYDSAPERHQTFDNFYTISADASGKYEITITIDEQFLGDPNTVYPVVIDPTITISTSGSGATKTIIDCPVYDGIPGVNQGSNFYNHIGYVGTSGQVYYGVGRTLMKFPGLINNSTFLNLKACQIESAILRMWENSGRSTSSTIYANYYTGNTWTETDTYKNNMSWSGYGALINSQTFGTSVGKWVEFDLTTAVRTWKTNTTSANKGIILRNSNESNSSYSKVFYSTENSSNKPYLTITYKSAPSTDVYSSNGGLSNRNVTIQLIGTTTQNATWSSIITTSRDAWNKSGAGVIVSTTMTGTSPHKLTVDSYPAESWYGVCYKYPDGNVVATSSLIRINTSTIGASTNFRRSTVTHEIGHLFWLGDNPKTTEISLMSYSRDKETVYVPQAFDVYNILYKYTT